MFVLADDDRRQQTTTYLDAVSLRSSVPGDETTTILNWSGTHAVEISNQDYYEPETVDDVVRIVAHCHRYGRNVRPCGSALSPNGIAFNKNGMIGLANLDRIVDIDVESMTVTVQAGARVSQVVEALRPYGMTLPNLASIAEQQMGGFVQVGAHGTGRQIAPVDHYVTELKLVTPAKGLVTLNEENGDVFQLAKVGLGCLGVVVEVTMQCIPAHRLVEHTFVLTREEAKQQLDKLLKKHKHMRYMWIPYTDAVVVVTNDPEDEAANVPQTLSKSEGESFKPFHDLLLETSQDTSTPYTKEMLNGMGFGELRDALLALNPLDVDHVKRCNEAEARFWRNNEGYRMLPSDQLLQFDCGGQQWVWEVCFPTGTQEDNNGNDMHFMDELLQGIEENDIPAHSPIEQRWTASSSSLMSPANGPPQGLHSWVGIISYLPSDDPVQRRQITKLFTGKYCNILREVGQGVNATTHWAKLERPTSIYQIVDLQMFFKSRFPVHAFNEARRMYDPKNIMSCPLIDLVLGGPASLYDS
jgi:L-galactono-1,4-lactone dehydrogenase